MEARRRSARPAARRAALVDTPPGCAASAATRAICGGGKQPAASAMRWNISVAGDTAAAGAVLESADARFIDVHRFEHKNLL